MKQWVIEKLSGAWFSLKLKLKDWSHTIRVYLIWAHKMWLVHLEYRLNVILGSLGSLFWMGVTLITYRLIFDQIDSLAGWSWAEMVLLYGVYNLWWGIMNTFFNGGLDISDGVRSGTLDKTLLMPGKSFFYAAMKFEPEILVHSLTGLIIFLIAAGNMGIAFNWLNSVLFIILLLNSFLLIFFVSILFGSTAFWFIENRHLADFFWIWESLSKYPREFFSFSNVLYGLVHSLLPVVFITVVPTEVILGRINWLLILTSFLITAVFAVISRKIWRLGLKRYTGASI